MKICIVSDSHDRAEMLAAAVGQAVAQGARAVLHCGDVIGANTLRALKPYGLPVHVVHGNNLGDPIAMTKLAGEADSPIRYHGQDARLELGGGRIFMTHYPHYGHAMACTGDWDLVCCGHDHRAAASQVPNVKGGQTWLVNPGTVAGLSAPATFTLGDLQTMRFVTLDLETRVTDRR